jgi:arylsulfatase A-like enzyme
MLRRLLDSPLTYFAAAGLLVVAAIASQFELRLPARDRRGPEALAELRDRNDLNVVFIVVDTLRSDRMGMYGYGRPTTPNLDELAASGVVFRRVVAQSSWTKASMASLWTGTFPSNHGILRYNHALPEEAVLPAEIFREAGYRTAGIWRNGWISPNFGFGQGFDTYIRPNASRERKEILRRHPGTPSIRGTDEDMIESALEFLDNFGDERFLLYLHAMDVHQYVFDESSAKFGTSYSDAYDQSILWMDRLIGHLVAQLEERGLMDETLIVLASDHGEAFREHGFEGHARDLHREVTYVPFILIPPFRLQKGIVVDRVASNVDIWPTILDLLGLPALPGADGISLVPDMLAAAGEGSSPPDEQRPVFSELDRHWGQVKEPPDPLVSVTQGNLRLMMRLEAPEAAKLYDLSTDPMETVDLAESRPEDVTRLRELVTAHARDGKAPWGAPDEVELDAMRLDQLRALGYVIR